MAAPPPSGPYYPGIPQGVPYYISPQPLPGLQVRPPIVLPAPGQVVVSYEVFKPRAGCCQFDGLSQGGLIALIVLLIIFWPLAWIPCVMDSCFDQQQRPVYGYPTSSMEAGGFGGPVPVQMPYSPPVQTPVGGGGMK